MQRKPNTVVKTPIQEAVKKNLLRYMEEKKITQQEMSEKLGVTQATVSHWCCGYKSPPLGKIDDICDFFEIEYIDLFNIPKDINVTSLGTPGKGLAYSIPHFMYKRRFTHIGEIIYLYRKENRLSMDDFAEKSGLTKGYVNMLEKNCNCKTKKEIYPSIETLLKVSKAIGVPARVIYESIKQKPKELETFLDE